MTITVHPRAAARIRIVDSEGPVPRALVTFRKQGQIVRRVATDGNGVVEIGPVEAGNYAVSIRKSRYLTKTVEIELDGEISQDIRIEQGTVPLTVNVTDDYFSPARPIGDATVQVAEVGMVRTQPNGIQQISVPVNIRLDVEISKDGYTTVAQTVNVGEDPLRLRVHLRRTPSLSVEVFSDRVVVGERLLVEVTDEYNDPVANATVRIDGDSVAMTGADGRAAVELTAAGEHEITVTKGEVTSSPTTVIGVASNGATVTTAVGSETEAPGMPGFGVLVAILGILLGGVASRIG